MSIFKEVAKQSGLSYVTGYSIVNYGGEAVYIEGVSRLLFLSGDMIKMSAGKRVLEVTGKGLSIGEMETGAVIIKGRIMSVTESGDV